MTLVACTAHIPSCSEGEPMKGSFITTSSELWRVRLTVNRHKQRSLTLVMFAVWTTNVLNKAGGPVSSSSWGVRHVCLGCESKQIFCSLYQIGRVLHIGVGYCLVTTIGHTPLHSALFDWGYIRHMIHIHRLPRHKIFIYVHLTTNFINICVA